MLILSFLTFPSTGLRFFTVYSPAGRPDTAYFGFKTHTRLREGLKEFAEWYKEFYMKEDFFFFLLNVNCLAGSVSIQ